MRRAALVTCRESASADGRILGREAQLVVAPAEEHERLRDAPRRCFADLAEENDVLAGIVLSDMSALDRRDRLGEDGAAVGAETIGDAAPLLGIAFGETRAERPM